MFADCNQVYDRYAPLKQKGADMSKTWSKLFQDYQKAYPELVRLLTSCPTLTFGP